MINFNNYIYSCGNCLSGGLSEDYPSMYFILPQYALEYWFFYDKVILSNSAKMENSVGKFIKNTTGEGFDFNIILPYKEINSKKEAEKILKYCNF